jgi:Flp pilus assembly protein CpaB
MVLAGLSALLLNLAVLRGNDATVEIAVAATDIGAGTTLEERHIATAVVPADGLTTARLTAASDVGSVLGGLATRPIAAGDPVLESDLVALEHSDGLRAMSIPIDQSRAVSGRLVRGDTVDIILVKDGISAYIATGVEVLEVPGSETNALGARTGYAPTVAVDATQALLIAAALDGGEVHIVRSTGAPAPDLLQTTVLGDADEGESE